jgi:hypothetical protein
MKNIKIIAMILISIFAISCSKDDDTPQTPINNYPLEGEYYISVFATMSNSYFSIVGSVPHIFPGNKTIFVVKRASQPNTYIISPKTNLTKVIEYSSQDPYLLVKTISSPENSSQVFKFNKVSNIDAYNIIPLQDTSYKLNYRIPSYTFDFVSINVIDETNFYETRFVFEPI